MAAKGKRMSVKTQLKLWVRGESVHNAMRDECTPDFSCCRPELLDPKKVREAFANASETERPAMLAHFLGAMLKNYGCKVVS